MKFCKQGITIFMYIISLIFLFACESGDNETVIHLDNKIKGATAEEVAAEVSLPIFKDISRDDEQRQLITNFYEKGILKGFEDGTFRPDEPLTEAQFLVMLTNFFDQLPKSTVQYEEMTGDWADTVYEEARKLNLPLAGIASKGLRNEPVGKNVVVDVFQMLFDDEEGVMSLINNDLSENKEDNLTRLQFVQLLSLLEKNGYDSISDERIEKLKESYVLQLADEKQENENTKLENKETKEGKNEESTKKEKDAPEQPEKQQKHDQNKNKPVKQADAETAKSDKPKSKESKSNSSKQINTSKPSNTSKTNYKINTKPGVHFIERKLPADNYRPRETEVTHIMLHFMSNGLNKPHDPFNMKDIESIFRNYGVSTHYVIDRDGKIYRFVDEKYAAYHAGKGSLPGFPSHKDKMNDYSIGIELLAIGTREEMEKSVPNFNYDAIAKAHIGYTEKQYEALNRLLNDILKRYPHIPKNRKHIIGHDEYAPGRKYDPGSLFDWSKIGL